MVESVGPSRSNKECKAYGNKEYIHGFPTLQLISLYPYFSQ